ncbi:hypothetical protein DC087_12370 [Clostridioides difficile]|nr:hypothetical protein [Clostridioides difficile]
MKKQIKRNNSISRKIYLKQGETSLVSKSSRELNLKKKINIKDDSCTLQESSYGFIITPWFLTV